MKLGCERHAHELTVYKHCRVVDGEPGEVETIGIYCKKCRTYKRVWPEQARRYYCRHCGMHSAAPLCPCPKCGASTPFKAV